MNELSLHILDICQNSTKANSTLIEINIIENTTDNLMSIEIIDNGYGMDKATLEKVVDPFFTTRTKRKVGLGISLFKLAAEQSEGYLTVNSIEGTGTTINAVFKHDHIDRAPLGDIEDTIAILLLNSEVCEIRYQHTYNNLTYIFDTIEVKKILNGVSITNYDVILWIKNNIKEGIFNIHKEVLV